MTVDEISATVLREAIGIHRELGPGLFESVYETVLAVRLERAGLRVARQVPVPIAVDDLIFDAAFKIDILVEDQLIIEIKSVEQLAKIHTRQVLTYLRLMKLPLGLLLNFSGETMKEGIRRVANDHRP
jgi:iron complex transport system substrate-binding protein